MISRLSISDLRQVAEELAEKYLDNYTSTLSHTARKEVNDALWGTIVLSPIEVAILDSPLLQRLRHVRQLGVAHWIYPSAVHTRFEHTLGVLHQVQQLVSALNSSAKQAESSQGPYPLISNAQTQLLRVCALLHDIGHAAFSHVSEKALEILPAFRTLSSEFTQELNREDLGEDKQLSEMLAYFIVCSPAMRRFLDALLSMHRQDLHFNDDHTKNLNAVIEKISRALIGRKIDDKLPLLHELISGPFDADKLDYLVRDARFAGIPSILDIPRLIQKLAVDGMPAKDLPEDIAGQLFLSEQDTAWLFGIKVSAKSVLDELQLARAFAYAKIYRHPKVVAVEQMMRAFIVGVSQIVPPGQLLRFLYVWSDDSIVGLSKSGLFEALNLNSRTKNRKILNSLQHAEMALQAIRERRLWGRAFQLNSPDIYGHQEPEPFEMVSLRSELNHPEGCEAFIKLVRDETYKLIQLNIKELNPSPDRVALNTSIMIRSLDSVSGSTQTGRAFLISANGNPVQLSAYMDSNGSWVEQYMSDQPRALIFSPPEIADLVFIAVERAAWSRHRARLPSSSPEVSKRSLDILREHKAVIPPGYWGGIPYDMRPIPSKLETSGSQAKIENFNKLRVSYHEPDAPEWVAKLLPAPIPVPDYKRTKLWLRQFGTNEYIDCALHLLESFKILTREDTTDTLKSFFRANPSFKDAWVIPFGSAKDSSAVQTYLSAGIEHISKQGSLEEYERHKDGRPLIFLDDFIGSGGQATDILAAWFNRNDLRKDLGEEREVLDTRIIECLKQSKIAFVFVSGWQSGTKAVVEITEQIGLNVTVYCHIKESSIPFAAPRLHKKFPGKKDLVESFLQHCGQIGEELLSSEPGKKIDAAKLKDRALGYGSKGMLMASFFNVPTQTLTAIWASGKADGVVWSPLLRRRKKT